ncbi:MAG: hypothetical protein AAF297_07615 [Planctomycetota bacterium]
MRPSRSHHDPDLDASKLGASAMGSSLDGTDFDGETDPALDDTVADVDVEEALGGVDLGDQEGDQAGNGAKRRGESEPGSIDDDGPGYDPEAGRGAIANKTTISGAVLNESGLFILGGLGALAGISSVIFAATLQTREYIIAALVIAPPTFVWFILRWKKWLGRAPYLYRMLTTLGESEDAEELLERHVAKKEQKVRAKISKLEAEQASLRQDD